MKKSEKTVDQILRDFYLENGINVSLINNGTVLVSELEARVYFALFPFCASAFKVGTMEEEVDPFLTHGRLVQMIEKKRK